MPEQDEWAFHLQADLLRQLTAGSRQRPDTDWARLRHVRRTLGGGSIRPDPEETQMLPGVDQAMSSLLRYSFTAGGRTDSEMPMHPDTRGGCRVHLFIAQQSEHL